jgi:hypothetical protein
MLTVLFNPNEFVRVNLLPQGTSFTTVYFVDNAIIPLDDLHHQQRGDTARGKLHLRLDNSKCRTARDIQEQMANLVSVRVSHPDIHPIWPSHTSADSEMPLEWNYYVHIHDREDMWNCQHKMPGDGHDRGHV